jgi:hypothetical protein
MRAIAAPRLGPTDLVFAISISLCFLSVMIALSIRC